MANYSVPASGFALHNTTLAASAEDTVTMPAKDEDPPSVVVWPGSPGPVFFTIDGRAATINGPQCYVCFPGSTVRVNTSTADNYATTRTIRLISAFASTYSVLEG
jgi:hypothetical protein